MTSLALISPLAGLAVLLYLSNGTEVYIIRVILPDQDLPFPHHVRTELTIIILAMLATSRTEPILKVLCLPIGLCGAPRGLD